MCRAHAVAWVTLWLEWREGNLQYFCFSIKNPLRDKGIWRVIGTTLYAKNCLGISKYCLRAHLMHLKSLSPTKSEWSTDIGQ